jgi:hypothetical protein
MWDCDEERNNSKYQNYQPDYGQSSHAQILRWIASSNFDPSICRWLQMQPEYMRVGKRQ